MHVRQVLSRWLEQRTVVGHAMRAVALTRVVQALVLGGKAALTQLGRSRAGSAHANTVSHRLVLSTPFVGRLLLLGRLAEFPPAVLEQSLAQLRALISQPRLA